MNMEEAKNLSSKLLESIDVLIEELQKQRDENQALRQQIVLLKAENEAKNSEISSLYDEIGVKERELENVLNKIQNVLGRQWMMFSAFALWDVTTTFL